MTQQEQFEADYLAAFPRDPLFAHFPKKEDGSYWLDNYNDTYAVWLQQAKRHEAEIAELVAALKLASGMLGKTNEILAEALAEHPARNADAVADLLGLHDCRAAILTRDSLIGLIAKYEVKKS